LYLDTRLSTLRRFVEAMGDSMHIVVTDPDGGPFERQPRR
jgi:hypothetical protein